MKVKPEDFVNDWINDVTNERTDQNEHSEYSEREVIDILDKYKDKHFSDVCNCIPAYKGEIGEYQVWHCEKCKKPAKQH